MSVSQVPLRPIAKGSVLKLWLAIAALVAAAFALAYCATAPLKGEVTDSGLQFRVLEEGDGELITVDDGAFVIYEGRLLDGTVFDSSDGRPVPMLPNGVVPGFREALLKMREGGSYRVVIPSELAYGDQDNGPIPANSDLEFDVEIESVVRGAALMVQQQQQQGLPPQ
ncbi:FKBP-type peptidyl-prolyl cis-trans isomerase [Sphingomicrobium clamense]|uniref:Peptidyl-prolyl cis-trans isomerase n=1 Tax=Sphingomicrobium clamense TaxID=2851013 RepID=A0ABS6V2G9_9SPHN|nr:FKBP-type peptidyl-prolyl cis-trans isomerase [Sphingomicrobium sp. B8]MBW0143761.1 FKBP-type peptidyl-prolyl cis-trans isomerase [Sphingomicrobium sp. B8]